MSGREWKPGDVAMVNGDVCMFLGVGMGWEHGRFDEFRHRFNETEARPLVVIDPESNDVERLQDLYLAAEAKGLSGLSMQAALREFAKPPKPAEPTGLGAVVEDAAGVEWVRTERRPNLTGTVWTSAFHVTKADRAEMREYVDIAAVRVLSEGVTA